MATVKKKKKSNFVDQVVNGEYQSIFSKNNAGTGSNTVSLLGDDSPFLSTQKKSSFADQVVNGTYDSIINTVPKSSKGEKETTTLSSRVGNINKEGYKSTGKKYGDYKYQGYKERKDYEIYEKEGKYYYYDAKRKSYIPMDQVELTTPELDKKSYEEAKKQGYTGSKDTLKISDRIKLDTANLTEEEYKDYKKDLERQQEDKEEAEKRKNRVRVGGAGLKGSLGELETLFSNAGANIDDNIIEPVRDVKDNYKVGKMTEQLGLEAYKKMTGEKNDYDKIRKEYDKYVTFNEDIVNNANYLDQAIQTIPNQVGGLIAGAKGGGIGGIAGAILGGGVGAVATRTPQGALVGAEKGAKFLGQAGYVGGQSQYTYKIEAGLQYQTLIDMGVPEDIAKKEAKDTGLFNALVEGGESILDLFSFGGISKVKGALTKKLVEKYGEETVTRWAGKTALQNLVTEGLEEGIQEGGSIHNEKQALEQAGIERDDSKDWERIKESIIAGGLAGFLLGGGVSAVTGTAKVGVKAINEKAIKSNVDQQINAYEKETGIKLTTDEKKELLNETLTRAKEIQNTQKVPISQQETELQKQQFVYEAKDTDSEARIKLAQTTDVLNNSKDHHELFELTSKIAEDTGISIKFVNDSKQEMVEEKQRFTQKYAKSSGITLEEANSKLKGLTIDGFVNDKGELIVNADSPKALNVILGHETTHLFENTKEYAPLQKALFELAETRGDMKKLREDMTKLYEGTNANIDNEITSELAGEYLFTDQDFINRLSAEQPSTFKKIYDYLKHLYKTVTAQNKEARQLEQVMYRYEKAYKEFSKTNTQQSKTNLTTEAGNNRAKELSGTKYSLSDNQGRTLSKEQQEYFKDSKVRDEEGNLKVMYHGTEAMAGLPEEAWFTVFDTKRAGSNGSFFGTGFYFTDSKKHAQDYAHSKGKVYETYLNIKNPYIPYENLEDSISRTFKEDLIIRLNINKEASSLTGKEITDILKENGYDGVINGDTVVAFYPEQIKNVDNTTPTNNPDIRYSLSTAEETTDSQSVDDRINASMTMAEAKKMIQIAFQVNDIKKWYDNKYTDGDDWLNDVGTDEVATYVENTFATIENYLNPLYDRGIGYGDDFYIEDIIEAYQKGNLKGSDSQQATRLDTSVENDYKDDRFYAPQTIEADIELYNKANQRVTNKNSQEIYKARGQFIIAVHQKGYAEQLGLTQEEVNKKIKAWAGYSRRTLELSNKVNEGVATQNKWAGLENSSIVNTISVSNEDLSKMVKEIKGDSSNWQRQYITSTMLALDTHIDYSQLTFEFDQQQALRQENALGDYNRSTKTIRIGNGYQNTVAHEIGHYIDNKWAEEFGFSENSTLTQGLNFDSTTLSDKVKQFNKNFQIFMDGLVKSATTGYGTKATYYQNRGEVFARFVGKFVEWTKNQATNNRYGYEDKFYTDNFTERQYREFIKILQEKSMLDTTETQFSLSREGQEMAPIGNGKRIYGNKALGVDIAPLEQKIDELSQKISDLQENIAPVSQDIVERENMYNFNTLTDEDAPTNLSDEETRELNRLNSLPFDLEGEEQSRVDELTRKQDEYGNFILDNETPEVKNKSAIIKDLKGFGMSQQEARNLYNKIANDITTTPEDIFEELKNYRDIYEESDYYKQIRNDIKGTRLNISNIKDQIKDYGNSYRMSLMGKRLILGNSGQSIDTFYQELSNNYPDVFSPEITAEADQLDAIADFLYRDDKMLVDRLSDGEITELANKIYNEIDTTERLNNTRETLYSNSNFKNLVSLLEAGEITPETYEDFLKSLPKELSTKYEPYLAFARELNASSTDKTRQKDRIRSLLDEKSIKVQETTNEPTISSNNPFNELLDKFLKRKRTKQDVVPKVEKSKVRNLVDTTKELFVNRNAEIDNLAKESGNLNIKYAGDMLNSVAGEVEGDIYTAQTDNYGHEIGKSVSGLFQEAKNKGLYDAFNDYLEQYSNIDRHSRGKGSQTPLAVSQKLVQDYEKSYPGFKKMAEDVWKYSSNIRDNMVESGLITQEFSDKLAEMYPHYVPFMENREMTNVYQDIGEAKPKGVIKYAKGGAKNLLPVEEALTKYTYAYKKAIRQNQLYQQIVNTLNDKVEIGADVRSDPTELNESLYRDEKGNYLTAYVNGKQESVRISDDLYRGLKNDMENRLKDLEQRLSLITKPLQKVSKARRNLLTTWSPTFIITNPVKDIQDAVFNSKYTKDMLKNYPTSFMELSRAKNETAKQFLALYGSGNTQGDYSIDSGLNNGIAKKNTKFLKGISKLNNIVELAPRYAEFKASLENGATVPEAMYNAREITTNFNRGGTITKALNRNGATFLNTSVQGFDKFVRNFSGENGAKGVASALLKAGLFGVLPGVFNELVFGGDDDDKDEDYEALPDYIKDNYYLVKTGDGNFIRIPKGRMLSVFGSASRRTIEYLNGKDDAFEGFLKNAYTQVGFDDPAESNIFTPIKQAIDNKAWYGGDLVPSRLQKLAPKEQYDASTDKFSIWLGDKLNISPYKINYVLEQYTGGLGDMVLPLITEEAQSDSDSIPEMMLAPIRDKFTANSISDNKYASDIYNLSDKMDKATSDIKETDEYKIQDIYLYDITSQMAELYQERRDVQADTSLSKSEKYKKVQAIQEQINSLAKEGLDNYKNVQKTDNYAIVGGMEFNKYTTDDGKERWGKPREDELNDLNSMGMTLYEKSSYFKAKTDISSIKDEYKDSEDYVGQKRDIIDVIKNTYLNDEQKSYLYDRYYGNTETLGIINAIGIDFDSYLDYEYQNFTADKDENGKTISGSKKQKVFDYINSMDIDFEQKLILAKLQYKNYNEYNYDIVDYLNNNDDISYEDEVSILKKLGFTVDDEGNIYW